jgi:hypothetical protein
MSAPQGAISGSAAGVPFLVVPPANSTDPDAPVVVAWHLMDPPRTEAAFAAALPLAGLHAWRIYLGLPMCGARLPAGGHRELMQLGYTDAVMNLQWPIAAQGAEEFPAAFAELRRRFRLGDGPVALVGGSMGSAVAQLVLTEIGPGAGVLARAAVMISPIVQLRAAVDATGRRFGVAYPWTPVSLAVADRLDLVKHADDLDSVGQPALLLICGADDDQEGFVEPAQRLHAALSERYDDPARIAVNVVPGMGHALAEAPGDVPAQQTPQAVVVDSRAVTWLRQHLGGIHNN